jgi:predicted GNAT superfamily acetyltransferase
LKILIRELKTIEEIRLIQDLERLIWKSDPIPIHQTFTTAKNGGLVLGAFDGDKIIGFSYGFPGITEGKLYLCSHMLGIHPDYQLMGVGKLLKERQLDVAKEMGYDLIMWTFDPLETRNAYLNVSKLYGICDTYLVNWYGEMEDGLNKGLPSDRLKIAWWITSKRVQEQWKPQVTNYDRPFDVVLSEKENPVLLYTENKLDSTQNGIEIPIPSNIQFIKTSEPELALAWRMHTRTIFQNLFAEGYALVGVNKSIADAGVHYYQLVKANTIPLNI